LLLSSHDATIREWDVGTGRELQRFEDHTGWVNACAYSPDGTRVLSAWSDRTLREWAAATGRELRRFVGHTDAVNACAYSPDGTRVLSASDDSTIKVWSREEAGLQFTLYGTAPFTCLAVRAGQFAAGDEYGNVWILDWDSF
jgi:WD40 repeat protein